MRRATSLAALVGLAAATGCGYSPNPASGTLKCGPSASCPEGYTCADGLTCWKNGAYHGDAGLPHDGSTADTGGGSTDAGAAGRFIGHWVFGATAMRVIACTDGSTNTSNVSADYFDVAEGTISALTASYYCVWNLDVAASGTSTAIRPGTTCSAQDPQNAAITYTWQGQSFTLTTTDGKNGTLDAQLPYDYASTTMNGSCTMHYTGPVTKS